MVNAIKIFVEGGSFGKDVVFFRQGFSKFISKLVATSHEQLQPKIIPCGSRGETYKAFRRALRDEPEIYHILLLDSEKPVSEEAWKHLSIYDRWKLTDGDNEHCHLMVEMMESWFIADIEALERYYGSNFHSNAIPRNPNVEKVSKRDVKTSLKKATQDTGKGEYHKTKHAPQILSLLDASKVRSAAPHCDRLFTTLAGKIGVAL